VEVSKIIKLLSIKSKRIIKLKPVKSEVVIHTSTVSSDTIKQMSAIKSELIEREAAVKSDQIKYDDKAKNVQYKLKDIIRSDQIKHEETDRSTNINREETVKPIQFKHENTDKYNQIKHEETNKSISFNNKKTSKKAKNRLTLRNIIDVFASEFSKSSINKKVAAMAIAFTLVISGGVGVLFITVYGAQAVKTIVTIEAGSPVPDAGVFAVDADDEIEYASDISHITLNKVGDIELTVILNDITHDVILRVIDTIPPTASPYHRFIALYETQTADAFIKDINDATKVEATFKEEPDFSTLGKQDFVVILEDEGGNITEVHSCVYIFSIGGKITIEAGTNIKSIPLRDFLTRNDGLNDMYEFVSMEFEIGITQEQANSVGDYDVSILLSETLISSYISVIDTTPPIGKPKNLEIWLGKTAEPIEFVQYAHDYSEFSARFLSEPDFYFEGVQEVTVILEDIYENAAEFSSTLTIIKDTIPPEIRGAVDITVFEGATVLYREGVTAWDNADGYINFDVDSSAVKLNTVGKYPVTYSAIDSSGNKTSVTITLSVIRYTPATVHTLVDSVLSKIINSSMGQTEKARAIHRWVRSNIRYGGNTERDRLKAAHSGLQRRVGDCYTYYAVSSLMLERAGINNIQIRRTPGARSTNHYWNLIQIGGSWYHFDATPNNFGFFGFMFTADEALRISAHVSSNYYAYDPSLYPTIVGAQPVAPPPSDGDGDNDNEQDNPGGNDPGDGDTDPVTDDPDDDPPDDGPGDTPPIDDSPVDTPIDDGSGDNETGDG